MAEGLEYVGLGLNQGPFPVRRLPGSHGFIWEKNKPCDSGKEENDARNKSGAVCGILAGEIHLQAAPVLATDRMIKQVVGQKDELCAKLDR